MRPSEILESIAQNDYMIDQHYLPTGNNLLAIARRLEQAEQLLRDCAEHFAFLRNHSIFVWPNHTLNPEARIAEWLKP